MSNPMGLKIYLGPQAPAEQYLDAINFTSGSGYGDFYQADNYTSGQILTALGWGDGVPPIENIDQIHLMYLKGSTLYQAGKIFEITNIEFSENGIDWDVKLDDTWWKSPTIETSYDPNTSEDLGGSTAPKFAWNGTKWVIDSNVENMGIEYVLFDAKLDGVNGHWINSFYPAYARVTFNIVDL